MKSLVDRFTQFIMANEAFFKTSEKSMAKFEKFISDIKTKFRSLMDIYDEIVKDIDQLDKKMADHKYKKDRACRKEIDAIVNKFYRNSLAFDPLDLIKYYRDGTRSIRFRAERKSDTGKQMDDDFRKLFASPDGEMYKLAKTHHDNLYAADKNGASTAVRKRYNALITSFQQQQMLQQQQMFIMQQQQALHLHLQAVDMHNQMALHQTYAGMGMF